MRRPLLRNAWLLCLAVMATRAFADSTHEQADALFLRGKSLMSQQKLAEACAAFEGSNRLEPNISTLLNHANCREKNGQFATAWWLFTEAKWQTYAQLDARTKQLNKVATEHATKLEARLSKLSIEVPPIHRIDGLEIVRGKERIKINAWSRLLPIDGGTYKITAHAPGHLEWSMTVTIKSEHDTLTIIVPRLDSARAENAMEEGPGLAMQNSKPTPHPASSQPVTPLPYAAAKRSLAISITMNGAALVLGGAAFAFSRWGDSIYADAEREPNDAKQEALWQSANRRRHAALGFAAGAAGCVVAAFYLYLRGGREVAPPVAGRSLRITPTATASSMGIGMSGAW